MKHSVRLNYMSVPVASLWLQPSCVRHEPFAGKAFYKPARSLPTRQPASRKHPSCGRVKEEKKTSESLQSGLGRTLPRGTGRRDVPRAMLMGSHPKTSRGSVGIT